MPARRPSRLAALAALAALAGACGGAPAPPDAGGRPPVSRALVEDSPPRLAGVYRQAGELLGGGATAFRARLRVLRGYPVVVNKWASWCGPCRSELPFFRRQAERRGDRIAFLGANTNDSDGPARRFLAEVPLPFPSYADQNGDVAQVFGGNIAFPTTAFYGRDGRLATVKQGVYESERELAADIDRYAR